jgi:ribonuclease D
MENPAIEKIMHSPSEDISLMKICGCTPQNILDTETAARVINAKERSLGALLNKYLDLTLNKDEQTSNWTKRPLTMSQIVYAAHDVLHLAELWQSIKADVLNLERWEWFLELNQAVLDCEVIENPTPHLNLKDAIKLSAYHQYILKAIYDWRDTFAKKMNLPPSSILSNPTIVTWATTPPTLQEWLSLKGVYISVKTEKQFNLFIENYKNAVAQADKLGLNKEFEIKKRTHLRTREDADAIRELFKPLRNELKEMYGETAASLFINNVQIDEICLGKDLSILRKFAQPIVLELITDLGLPFDKYNLLSKEEDGAV